MLSHKEAKMNDIRLMCKLFRASIRAQTVYKMDFLIGMIGTLAYNALFLASIGIITSKFGAIGGFTSQQVVLLYALFEICHGLYGFFLYNMSNYLSRLVVDGTFDMYLTRPCSVLLQLNGQKVNFRAFIDLFIGGVCFAAVAGSSGIVWSVSKVLMLPMFFISGAFIEFALSMLMNCGSMVSPNLYSLYGAYYQLVLIGQRYPLNLFSRGLQAIMTFIFPLGFVNYYTMLYLTGSAGGWIGLLAPGIAAVFTVLAVAIFNLTLKHYASTGN